jgi:hypothetical protein
MDTLFLPSEIKARLEKEFPSITPHTILRSTGNLSGEAGEGYVIGYNDSLFLFSRKLGDSNFTENNLPYSEIPTLRIEQQDFNSLLVIQTNDKHYSIRFSNYDSKDAEEIASRIQNNDIDEITSEQKIKVLLHYDVAGKCEILRYEYVE